ncbi:Sec-independent protein translocase subunit TatA [Actinoallomurus sp. NBC_01490]|jgi:sec-independent protein translocase protein TatA|uniref:Sec-independent protein translocase subunit TatA n=1 Tax=Actinoallomurus sp. NBC_01490 TaxID=2903557 RepID=UPI002E33D3F3|nr:Sec-independent protein translocase subunit TatA [Actinoallomurus sp. NBC_01490]
MDLGPWEIAIIAVVILVLFGSAKLPQAARSLGRSMRIFKSETKGLIGDDDEKQSTSADARTEAARLRAEAARLEAQAGPQELKAPVDDAVKEGVPVRQSEHGK